MHACLCGRAMPCAPCADRAHLSPSRRVEELLQGLAMRYTHQRSMHLDTMLHMLSNFNRRAGPTLVSGVFLTLYNLFQGSTTCRAYSSDCSQSFATLALAFFHKELSEPSLLNALLLTFARNVRCPRHGHPATLAFAGYSPGPSPPEL